ncbi:MAG: hypothetical protein A2X94_13885 [Bdellovibrionales bacterium GWB1_55_8]|nr:MAG: hypothetical protein A2X94_13885 [Bdellovibrionales bacterium GWB1_55_8]
MNHTLSKTLVSLFFITAGASASLAAETNPAQSLRDLLPAGVYTGSTPEGHPCSASVSHDFLGNASFEINLVDESFVQPDGTVGVGGMVDFQIRETSPYFRVVKSRFSDDAVQVIARKKGEAQFESTVQMKLELQLSQGQVRNIAVAEGGRFLGVSYYKYKLVCELR